MASKIETFKDKESCRKRYNELLLNYGVQLEVKNENGKWLLDWGRPEYKVIGKFDRSIN